MVSAAAAVVADKDVAALESDTGARLQIGGAVQSVRKTVLIVHSNEDVLLRLEWMLENAGFDTTTAWSGHEALRQLISQRFDLLLISDYLPDLEWQLVRHASLNGTRPPQCLLMKPYVPSATLTVGMAHCNSVYERAFSEIVRQVVERIGGGTMTAQAA